MEKVLKFVEHTKLPVYTTPMGKGSIPEDHPQFRGVFAGNCSSEQIQKEIHEADLILSIGSLNSDYNTGGFTFHLSQKKTIGELIGIDLSLLNLYIHRSM
jgi:pyruvate decarboxylase